jgi:hypothetical protein
MPMPAVLSRNVGAKEAVRRPRDDVFLTAGNVPAARGARIGLLGGPGDRYPVILSTRAWLPLST